MSRRPQQLLDDRLLRLVVHRVPTHSDDVEVTLAPHVAAEGHRAHEVRTNELVGEDRGEDAGNAIGEPDGVVRRRRRLRYFARAVLRSTAAPMSALKARTSTSWPSWRSIARRVFPPRLELNSPDGSSSAAPLAKVSFTEDL